jgi:DNA-binding MarR family transcriptional regulator
MPIAPSIKPYGCSNFKLRQLTRRVSQHYDAELGKIGLKATQYSLLLHVAKLGPLRPGDLAHTMSIEASTMTRNLRPLVAAGWITIGTGGDARSRTVTITGSGRDKLNDARRHWKAAQSALNAVLGVDEVVALHALIDRSLARLAAREAGDAGA